MSLPSGYKRLEYIQSTGTQYIDTGFVPNQDTRVLMDITPSATTTQWVFGSRDASYKNTYCLPIMSVTRVRSDYNSGDLTKTVPSVLRRVIIDKNKNNALFGEVSFSHTYASFNSGFSLLLFSVNTGGAVNANMFKGKTYSCKIYDNGTLVRDFVPCQKPDGTIGLWDDVNSLFYGNAGTGTFTAGPVLAIAANASEITKLEYIESSGTQYVDSGFIPNGESTVEIAFESAVIDPTTSGNYPVYGAASKYNSNAFELWSLANGFCTYGSQTYKSGFGLSANVKYVSKQAKNVLEINNQTLTFTKQTFSAPYSLLLFATHRDDRITVSGSDAKLKIYFCKIYDNGTLIRDYIAAKLSDGTIGLYDKLHGLLYTNVGTGTFIAGPVVTSPSIFVNIDGIWKPINNIYVNINNLWQKLT